MRKKINKTDPKWEQMISTLSKTSKWRATKRGWCWLNYHKREINIDSKKYDEALVRNVVLSTVKKWWFMMDQLPRYYEVDDYIQEAQLRLYELSGTIPDGAGNVPYMYAVCNNLLRTKIKKYVKREMSTKIRQGALRAHLMREVLK
ncbi:MAG: hypothetical protein GY757_10080 [bacterium]|nr:hypothetical protein [bacterium]